MEIRVQMCPTSVFSHPAKESVLQRWHGFVCKDIQKPQDNYEGNNQLLILAPNVKDVFLRLC